MKHLTKLLLIVLAIVGLAIGMSSVAGYNNSSDNVNTSIFVENDINNNLTDSKCGGNDAKADKAKADVKEAKCGEGKTDEGKCGGDDAKAEEAKCGTGKCG